MKSILVLVRKDFANFRRDRSGALLTFLIPLILIVFFGKVFGIGGGNTGHHGIPFAVVNESKDPVAAKFIDALHKEDSFTLITTRQTKNGPRALTEADLRSMMQADDFHFALVIPADAVSERGGIHVKYLTNPNNLTETEMVSGLLQKVAFTSTPQLLGRVVQGRMRDAVGPKRTEAFDHSLAANIAGTFGGDEGEIFQQLRNGDGMFDPRDAGHADASESADGFNQMLQQFVHVDKEQVVGADVKSQQATQMIGGWAMQFLLFAVTSSSAALFAERERGLFQRILSGPTRRSDILWSKFIFGVTLGLLQLVVLFIAGHFLFQIEVAPYLGRLVLVCVCAAASCASFGMLIASISSSQEAARGFSTLVILLMSALGGAWFPISIMPAAVRSLAHLTLVYWSIEGFMQVLWAHATVVQILPTIGVLVGMTALVMSVAWWRFARGAIFD